MSLKKLIRDYLWEEKVKDELVKQSHVHHRKAAEELILELKRTNVDLVSYIHKFNLPNPTVSDNEINFLTKSFRKVERRVRIEEAKAILHEENYPICAEECERNKEEVQRNASIALANQRTLELFYRKR